VVARGWGIPAVVGASALRIGAGGAEAADGARIEPGDVVTIDGSTGEVWLGVVEGSAAEPGWEEALVAKVLPELGTLTEWASGSARVANGAGQ